MTWTQHFVLGALALVVFPLAAQAQSPSLPPVIAEPCPQPGCKEKFCASPLGQLTNNMLAPVRHLTGGVVPDCCGQTLQAGELARAGAVTLLSPAEIAAAKIKADEAGMQARRNAVRYLAGKNCHYYPEAEFALIAALRADRCECVRHEAALALAGGCCCTRNVVQALTLTVQGGDQDGNPCEQSERVKAAAQQALQRCQAKGIALVEPALPVPPPPSGEAKPLPKGTRQEAKIGPLQLTNFATPAEPNKLQLNEVTDAERRFAATAGTAPAPGPARPAQPRSLIDLFTPNPPTRSSSPTPTPAVPTPIAPTLPPLRPIGQTPLAISE